LASDWSAPEDFTSANRKAWKSKITSASDTVDFKHVSEAPENLMLTPEDFEIVPEDVQSDKEEWAIVTLAPANDADQWTPSVGEND